MNFEAAKAILKLIEAAGYEAFIIGGNCRTSFHNSYHKERLKAKDIDIVTNADIAAIKNIFPKSEDVGKAFKVIVVNFANNNYEIASYRSDNYFDENGEKLLTPVCASVKTLDEDRARRDFSINALAQDLNGNFLDYTFTFKGKKYSGMEDIKNKVIRAIGNPEERFYEDPLRILRAFRFMAQLGYNIEPYTLSAIKKTLKYLKDIPGERIGQELRKIMSSKYAYKALTLMQHHKLFLAKCDINTQKVKIFEAFNDINFDVIKKFNRAGLEFENWSELLHNDSFEELTKFNVFNKHDLNIIKWLINNDKLYEANADKDFVTNIFNSISPEERKYDIHHMRALIDIMNRKYLMKNNNSAEAKEKVNKVLFWLCARPYFINQLDITGQEIMTIVDNAIEGTWIGDVKSALLHKLTFCDHYPRPMEIYRNWLPATIKEVKDDAQINKEAFQAFIAKKAFETKSQ